jgi:transcriptional regulator with XRE-family HTH domain
VTSEHRRGILLAVGGLSQYALAKKSGLSRQAVSNLEAGNRESTWQTVQLLAAALGVDCTSFLDPNVKPPEEERARPRGRPKKDASSPSAEVAPKKGKGKERSKS